jgi:hypothetical protein
MTLVLLILIDVSAIAAGWAARAMMEPTRREVALARLTRP